MRYFEQFPIIQYNQYNTRNIIAKDFFPVLRTFVVPILPDPIFLMSFFKNIFVKTKPKGIDPKK